jgi:multisubunit Na+/H+ antiporter MnhF subunit
MLPVVSDVAMFGLSVSMALCLYRLLVGPDIGDRLMALDTISTNLLAFLGALSIRLNTELYLESVLVLAVLAFVGTVALAKYLVRGRIIE